MTDLSRDLRSFIVRNFLFGRDDVQFGETDSLMERGIIDSTGVLELIAHLEESHGIKVDDEDLVPENLDTISNLVAFVTRKKSAA